MCSKKEVYFNCSHPIIIKGQLLPCGKCAMCRKRKISDWTFRCLQEAKGYKNNMSFITLTYNEENINDSHSLVKKDLQDFFKRLRKSISPLKIKYFACGEYGKQHIRPHYHIILYGMPANGNTYDLINKKWNKGFIKVEPVNARAIRYVAKYCVKQFSPLSDKQGNFYNENGELIESQFILSSRRKALGRDYFDSHKEELCVKYCSFDKTFKIGDFKFALPRYYKNLIKKELKNNDIISQQDINSNRDACFFVINKNILNIVDFKDSVDNLREQGFNIKIFDYSVFEKLLLSVRQKEIDYCNSRGINLGDIRFTPFLDSVYYKLLSHSYYFYIIN